MARFPTIGLIMALGLAVSGAQAAQPNPSTASTVARFTGAETIPIVTARMKGKEYRLVLDTGAQVTILPVGAAPVAEGDGLRLVGANGTAVNGGVARGVELAIGPHLYRPERVVLAEMGLKAQGIDGVLGADFFRKFSVAFDKRTGAVEVGVFRRAWNCPADQQVTTRFVDDRFLVESTLNGQPFIAALDTGAASIAQMSPAAARARNLPSDPSRTLSHPTLGVGGGLSAIVAREQRLGLGPATMQEPYVSLGAQWSWPEPIEGLLGYYAFRDWDAILDLGADMICLRAPEAGKPVFSLTGLSFRPGESRAIVEHVIPGSPGDKAGMRRGDIIVYVDKMPLSGMGRGAREALFAVPKGRIEVIFRRDRSYVVALIEPTEIL